MSTQPLCKQWPHHRRLKGTFWTFNCETPEVETMLSQVQLLLMVSFSSMLLVEVSSAPRKHMPSELLPADPLKDKVSAST